MNDWRHWSLQDWNEHLLEHFFRKTDDGNSAPIVSLLVTKEELSKVTDDKLADPAEVQRIFVAAVLAGIPDEMTLLEHACSGAFNPDYASPIPHFVAHLVVTCLAASESSDELRRVSSYRFVLPPIKRTRVERDLMMVS